MNKLYLDWILKLLRQIRQPNTMHLRLIHRLSNDLLLSIYDWHNCYEFVAGVMIELDYLKPNEAYTQSAYNMCLLTCTSIKCHLGIPFIECAAPVLFSEEGVKWRYAEN